MTDTGAVAARTLREQVAFACRILALEGYADLTLGHVSARVPGSTMAQIKRRGVALDEVEPEDVIPLGLDDRGALAAPAMHLEAVLHTEVYRRRPDVGAVVHGHPPYATALAATGARLELLTHDSVLFADGISVFDETPELITAHALGAAVAEALGDRRVVLLANHGVLVVGKDVGWTVLTALTLERAIRLQALARGLGELAPIRREDALAMLADKYNDALVAEYWAAWQRKLRRSGLSL